MDGNTIQFIAEFWLKKPITSAHLQQFIDLLMFGGGRGSFVSKGYSKEYDSEEVGTQPITTEMYADLMEYLEKHNKPVVFLIHIVYNAVIVRNYDRANN